MQCEKRQFKGKKKETRHEHKERLYEEFYRKSKILIDVENEMKAKIKK